MGFFAPLFLAGVLAVGLPVYLHLLQQHKIDPQKFPSLQFFERRTETSVRQRRLKYRLLFALRALILILLALLFANPFIKRHFAGSNTPEYILFLIDNSYSMNANNALERAKQDAIAEVNRMPSGATAQVLSFAGSSQLLTQPAIDKAELVAAIQSIQPGSGRSSLTEVARSVKAISDARKIPITTHVFSDFQRTSMPSSFAELSLPEDASLILHPLATQASPNYFVETVIAPSVVSDPKKVRLTATIGGNETPSGPQNVQLLFNGKNIQSKQVTLPENGRATVEFSGFDLSYGWNRGEVRLESQDTLPGDNTFRFAMERADPRRVLLIHEAGRPRSATYVRTALEAAAENLFALDAMSAAQAANADPSKYAFVILSDVSSLPQGLEASLQRYINNGGGVLVALGASAASRGSVPLTNLKITNTLYASRSAERFFSPAGMDQAHPSVARANRWDGVRFYQAIAVDAGNAAVAGRLNDGTPLLLDVRSGDGRVLVFTSTLDNLANDFPLSPSFVPFVEQTARYLAQVETRPATVIADSFVELRSADSQDKSPIEVLDPKGQRVLDLQESTVARNVRVTSEGYYEIGRQNGRRELVAVNADRAESALSPVEKETLDLWAKTGDSAEKGGVAEAGEKPFSLWWYLAVLLLLTVLLESFVASRHLEPENA